MIAASTHPFESAVQQLEFESAVRQFDFQMLHYFPVLVPTLVHMYKVVQNISYMYMSHLYSLHDGLCMNACSTCI